MSFLQIFPSQESFHHEKFSFSDYDAIGFDLDGTLAITNFKEMVHSVYYGISKYLIEVRNYKPNILDLPIEHSRNFIIRGIILDLKRGNCLRISGDGTIVQATHGLTFLSKQDIQKYYGDSCTWPILHQLCQEPDICLRKAFQRIAKIVFTDFDIAIALAFARGVTTVDIQRTNQDEYNVFGDIVDALRNMEKQGGFISKVRSDPKTIIKLCSPFVRAYLKRIKASGKLTFLVSNSNSAYVADILHHCIGSDFMDVFDVVVCSAMKPNFFSNNRRLLEDGTGRPAENMERKHIYVGGDWRTLRRFIERELGVKDPKVAYVGDDIICDVYPASRAGLSTVYVCNELLVEGAFGYTKMILDYEYLDPGKWGSFFWVGEEEKSVWHQFIVDYATCMVPSIEYVASNA